MWSVMASPLIISANINEVEPEQLLGRHIDDAFLDRLREVDLALLHVVPWLLPQ